MLELIAGLVVTLAALALVLEPLIARRRSASAPAADDADDLTELAESDSPKIQALLALREIEFDRATGKLADDDYRRLKARYESQAIQAIEQEEREAKAAPAAGRDLAEDVIRRMRQRVSDTCPSCGPRPEPGAVYCSTCGRSLIQPQSTARCWLCGATLPPDAKYCASCGGAVRADAPVAEPPAPVGRRMATESI